VLRIAQWGGVVTQASAYAIPPGGAVRQINLTCAVPGQLTSRGGTGPTASPPVATYRIQDEDSSNLLTEGSSRLVTRYGLASQRSLDGVITQQFPISGGIGRQDRLLLFSEDGSISLSSGVIG
jgi:hypothetical protein